jgi:hypothetical protein
MEVMMKRVDDWDIRHGYELNTLKVDVGRYTKNRGRHHQGTNTFMLPLDKKNT